MTPLEDWQHVAARLRSLLDVQKGLAGYDRTAASRHWVMPALMKLQEDYRAFAQRHQAAVSPDVLQLIERGLEKIRVDQENRAQLSQIPVHDIATGLIAALVAIEGEVSYMLQDFDQAAKPLVERAFLHLQRLLIVDEHLRRQWREAFARGETVCEKLGGVHLLNHGIYAFKADAHGARTDLVLGERLAVTSQLRQATSALVLTEWKLARGGDSVERKFEEARIQARLYTEGVMAGYELRSFRYLVVVSDGTQAAPEDVIEGPATYRHINIALDPATPSQTARQRAC